MSLSSRSLSMTRTKLTSNARQAYSSILYPNPSTHPHVFMIQPLYLSGEGRRHDNYRVLLTYNVRKCVGLQRLSDYQGAFDMV